ncbi:regulator of membrane protease activity [Aggregatibacter actinomycetemcomitans serotype e str. SC1083]|uniref:Regulator of membrane protease activity n=1 Tax=Aggregatibacter actinomycetemcomitans serotype e str. SC1083 TaxID=907488 RepID=G4A6Z9_AGGAC|nr:NfeD family protein [Aggregatibacter actinomycetemcomitans]EGY34203.1 regulator of membrane protease activity [Aggregatibacter actinomycetemcomitans serotype e str. SC1083]KYK75825.1 membrane protein [Aggregatibacter actinomycetemcomitans serotype e str. SA3096]KYK82447.1 membrane protein [Aggregatibacter actinomycetemcomitans serotype e str. SC936]KYK95264.1 membrane protein [Aggregatibacter actinomycetemcomitans serotype e str. ANH9776]TYB22345.1 NfeD family protein [Aggregatibacter actin
MEWLADWGVWHWLILGFILLIAEVVIPGVFLLWWGLAAIVVAGIMKFIPALPLSALAVIYAVIAIILSIIWWRYQHGKDQIDQSKSVLNQRDHAMVGARGKVLTIAENGIGRGAFGDTTWRIKGRDLAVDDIVEVVSVDSITLKVKKI